MNHYHVPWGAEFTFSVVLIARGLPDYKVDPTLATGDVKVSKDNGAFADINTLPTVAPASSRIVQVTLSATEMEAAEVIVQFVDQSPQTQWEEQMVKVTTEIKDGGAVAGIVQSDGGNTATTFKTNLTGADDVYNDRLLVFTTGSLVGQVKKVTDFVASTDFITVNAAFTAAPSTGDKFVLINR